MDYQQTADKSFLEAEAARERRIRNELIAQVAELETSAKLTVFVLNISSPLLKR